MIINKYKIFIAILIAAAVLVLAGFLIIYLFQNDDVVINDNYSKAGDIKLTANTFQIPKVPSTPRFMAKTPMYCIQPASSRIVFPRERSGSLPTGIIT